MSHFTVYTTVYKKSDKKLRDQIKATSYIDNFERSRINTLSLLHHSASDLLQEVVATHFVLQAEAYCLYSSTKATTAAFTDIKKNDLL